MSLLGSFQLLLGMPEFAINRQPLFLLAEILNFQGSTHRIGVGSLSYKHKDLYNKHVRIKYTMLLYRQ